MEGRARGCARSPPARRERPADAFNDAIARVTGDICRGNRTSNSFDGTVRRFPGRGDRDTLAPGDLVSRAVPCAPKLARGGRGAAAMTVVVFSLDREHTQASPATFP